MVTVCVGEGKFIFVVLEGLLCTHKSRRLERERERDGERKENGLRLDELEL